MNCIQIPIQYDVREKEEPKKSLPPAPLENGESLTAMFPAHHLSTVVSGAFGTIFNTIRDGNHRVLSVSPSFDEITFSFAKDSPALTINSLDEFQDFKESLIARTFLMQRSFVLIESTNLKPKSKFSVLYDTEIQGWEIFSEANNECRSLSALEARKLASALSIQKKRSNSTANIYYISSIPII